MPHSTALRHAVPFRVYFTPVGPNSGVYYPTGLLQILRFAIFFNHFPSSTYCFFNWYTNKQKGPPDGFSISMVTFSLLCQTHPLPSAAFKMSPISELKVFAVVAFHSTATILCFANASVNIITYNANKTLACDIYEIYNDLVKILHRHQRHHQPAAVNQQKSRTTVTCQHHLTATTSQVT